MLFPRLVDNFLVILRLENDLTDRGQWLFNSFAMIQSHPRRYDQVSIFRSFLSIFFYPKQTNKQVFHCRSQNAEFTGNSKVVDREIMISYSLEVQSFKCIEDRLLLSQITWGLKSTFINITGARYKKNHQGEWKIRIWGSGPVKSSAFFRFRVLTY